MGSTYDFSGWATRNDIECADGLTIRQDAFADCDGINVPLVYMHDHKDPENVLGHCTLENREDGVYCYGAFNDTDKGQMAKALVAHGDITSLSIFANQLVKRGKDVLHGAIREVSLVLAGAILEQQLISRFFSMATEPSRISKMRRSSALSSRFP